MLTLDEYSMVATGNCLYPCWMPLTAMYRISSYPAVASRGEYNFRDGEEWC
jgi:hypothetical protein